MWYICGSDVTLLIKLYVHYRRIVCIWEGYLYEEKHNSYIIIMIHIVQGIKEKKMELIGQLHQVKVGVNIMFL